MDALKLKFKEKTQEVGQEMRQILKEHGSTKIDEVSLSQVRSPKYRLSEVRAHKVRPREVRLNKHRLV